MKNFEVYSTQKGRLYLLLDETTRKFPIPYTVSYKTYLRAYTIS